MLVFATHSENVYIYKIPRARLCAWENASRSRGGFVFFADPSKEGRLVYIIYILYKLCELFAVFLGTPQICFSSFVRKTTTTTMLSQYTHTHARKLYIFYLWIKFKGYIIFILFSWITDNIIIFLSITNQNVYIVNIFFRNTDARTIITDFVLDNLKKIGLSKIA